jgi:hypothetical protein
VAREVFEGAVPLAVLPVDRRLEHDDATVAGASEPRVNAGDPHANDMGDPAWLRRASVAAIASSAPLGDPRCATHIWRPTGSNAPAR